MKTYKCRNIRNVALTGHGGSGKTTLAEALMFVSGGLDRMGKIADGNTVSDYDPDEIKRKISLNTTLSYAEWKDVKINIIDTPGQFDFIGGMHEGIRAAESVIITLPAKDGVQVGTIKAYKEARKLNKATMFVVTKMEEENSNFYKCLEELKTSFGPSICPIIVPFDKYGTVESYINLLEMKAYKYENGKATEVEMPASENRLKGLRAAMAEAIAETEQQLETYADLCENVLAMPVVRGCKTDKEKFAGAERTYTIECMMHDHKALQSGTSHYFGDGFARAFDISFSDKENKLAYPHQTSWGLSTRIIGGIIMTHGDNSGLVLPPRIAPIQVVVLPIAQHKEGVIEKAQELVDRLKAEGLRVKGDFSEQSAGWKFAEYEMKGVPLRVEIGPKDIEAGHCVAVRRDNGEKITVPLAELEATVPKLLDAVQAGMYEKAKKNLSEHTYTATTVEEVKAIAEGEGGFIKTMWCGGLDCELAMKEKAGVTSRCLPLEQEKLGDVCPCCGKKADKMVVWGVAY